MKLPILSALLLCITRLHAQDRDLLSAGEFVQVTTTRVAEITPTQDRPGFEKLLDKISITPSEGSSPASYIVAGRVVSGNTGGPLERIPILVGQEGKEPLLAALTNSEGEFRFRLWIKEDQRELEIQTTKDFAGYLYVGGSGGAIVLGQPTLPNQASTTFAQYRRYPLKRLLELSPVPKP